MSVAEDQAIPSLLAPDEAAPFELIEVDTDRPLVLACDHASNRVPRSLDELGLDATQLGKHIAWDIGAAAVTRRLSGQLQADAVLGGYSRLVVDLNRDLDDPTAFPRVSDGVLVPGNLGLSVEQKAERARVLFKPYHEALRKTIQKRTQGQRTPVLICVHSFTPVQHNVARPWDIGILWDKDARLALPLIAALKARGDLVVGDNEPYSGRHPADYTVDHHAEVLGLAYAAIEIRQDLISDESGQRRAADLLAEALEPLLRDDGLYRTSES